MDSLGWQIGVSILVLGTFIVAYLILAMLFGYTKSLRPVCAAGERAMSTDGSRSVVPSGATQLVTPDADYPICAPSLSCPQGLQWAFHADGSALTNICEETNCQCTAFQHCPAYASTLFRQFGADARISFFQVIDPTVKTATKLQDPYDPPNILLPGLRDSCFLNAQTLKMVWPPLALGDHCLRGTLGKIKNNPSMYVCAPSQYVSDTDHVFDVDSYMLAYKT
jgi:hypothetical protein